MVVKSIGDFMAGFNQETGISNCIAEFRVGKCLC